MAVVLKCECNCNTCDDKHVHQYQQPPTEYSLLFIDIILQTYMESIRNDDNEEMDNRHEKENCIHDDKKIDLNSIKVAPIPSSNDNIKLE